MEENTTNVWGHLAERYTTQRPRKLLALDGGGIRGVLTLEILAAIERHLASNHPSNDKFRLCDYFDYIAGTSTGAIIAAGLAIGMSAAELLDFYKRAGALMFEKTCLIKRLGSFYKSEPLAEQLQEIFGRKTTLVPLADGEKDTERRRIRCLLLVVTRNFSTDSPWPISSNPLAKYNERGRSDCNLQIPLWQLVRASTAAPVFFPPEVLNWDDSDPAKSFIFVDGGITPYNNPAFLLFRMATQPAYRLEWKTGERELLLVSVGTGAAPSVTAGSGRNLLGNLQNLPGDLMYAAQVDQDVNCRTFGRCVHGSLIDRELGDLVLPDQGTPAQEPGRLFRYVRYNADISQSGLEKLGFSDKEISAEAIAQLDAIDQVENLGRVGRAVAREVKLAHFGSFI
jgi:patatin-like phospholipase/acyl hydrolase